MDNDEIKTISFSFSYNGIDNKETTFMKVVDLPENDKDGIITLLKYFKDFLQLSGFEYINDLKIGIDCNYNDELMTLLNMRDNCK